MSKRTRNPGGSGSAPQASLRRALAALHARRRPLAAWLATLSVLGFLAWLWCFLRPDTWRYYTDETTFRQLARDVKPRFVLWEQAADAPGLEAPAAAAPEAALSPDGVRLVFTRGLDGGDANLYVARWDGRRWGEPDPLRALNSRFNERSPAFSQDGSLLFFATDRPGGPGGYDVWVARWDGAEYAWPVPLTVMINSPWDELGPAPSADGARLYFSSNRPARPLTQEEEALGGAALRERFSDQDHDLFMAARIPAGVTNREVERAMSMLYFLRESALGSTNVMARLGGSEATEQAVDRGLAWLAKTQETNGTWSIARHGGQPRHDVAATSFALLAFFGRGVRHDRDGRYRENVARGLTWLTGLQNPLTGDLRGPAPAGNAMYDHCIGTLALAEAYGLTKHEDLFLPSQSAVDFLADAQNPDDGGWRYRPNEAGDLSVSGWAIMALKSAQLTGLHVPRQTMAGIRRWLGSVSGGSAGGLYSYQPRGSGGSAAMVATGYFCSQLMGLSPNTPRAFETAAFLDRTQVQEGDIYYLYYGTLAAYQTQGRTWHGWNTGLHKGLLAAQTGDGSWSFRGNHGDSMGRVIGTALAALCLQAHYRYTPLYGLGYDPPPTPRPFSTLGGEDIAEPPLYRRAKRLEELSSAADDVQPCPTAHGDFLYFASARGGGFGGLDLYRARIADGRLRPPENLGPTVNTRGDETDPATRMAGFNLLFTARRAADPASATPGGYAVRSALSRQVYREHLRGAWPAARWMAARFRWHLAGVAAALAAFIASVMLPARAAQRRRRALNPARRTAF